MKLHSFKDKIPAKSDFPIWAYFTQGNGGWSSFVYCAGFDDVWPDFWTHWCSQTDHNAKPTQTPIEILKAQAAAAAEEPSWVWEYLKEGDIIQSGDVFTCTDGDALSYLGSVGIAADHHDVAHFARRKCWRKLEVGELVEGSDFFWNTCNVAPYWEQTRTGIPYQVLNSSTLYRRRIAPSPAPAPAPAVTLHLTSGATVKNGGEEINLDGATKPVRVLRNGEDLVAKVEHQRAELARQGEQLNEISNLIAGAGFTNNGCGSRTIVNRLKELIAARCDQESVRTLQRSLDYLNECNAAQRQTIYGYLEQIDRAHQALTDHGITRKETSLEARIDLLAAERDTAEGVVDEVRSVLPPANCATS